MARPIAYTEEIAAEVLSRMRSGQSVREIGRDPAMPAESTVRGWAHDDRDGFRSRFEDARGHLVEHWVSEIIEIADDATNDWMERQREDGSKEVAFDREHLERSKVRIEARKWIASKLLPKRYGDKTQLEHAGAVAVTWEQLVLQSMAPKEPT